MESTRSTPWYAHFATELKTVRFSEEIGYHGKSNKNVEGGLDLKRRTCGIPRAQGAVREGGV